jgi:hypothetical protein
MIRFLAATMTKCFLKINLINTFPEKISLKLNIILVY